MNIKEYLEVAKAHNWVLPNEVSYKVVREVVLLRDSHRCRECESSRGLVVHHVRYPEWDLKDLITLCAKCHLAKPKRTPKKPPQLIGKGRTILNLDIDPELRRRFKAICEEEGESMSRKVRRWILQSILEYEE